MKRINKFSKSRINTNLKIENCFVCVVVVVNVVNVVVVNVVNVVNVVVV
jgi:hypothetical protein